MRLSKILRRLAAAFVSVDRERRVVRAGLLGFIGDGLAIERPGNGCTVVPDGNLSVARRVRLGAAAGGQSTAIIPSRDLVIVRLGLTPSRARYTPQQLVKAVLQATK